MQDLRINEIFYSLQGESSRAGLPTTFIRLSGCPLRCTYCDTEYAFKGGERLSIESVIDKVSAFPAKYITVTGGEPLAQPACFPLLSALVERGFKVSIETSGAFDISMINKNVMVVMDLKTPDSNECAKNLMSNIQHLKKNDEIKFVICSRSDYEWAKQVIKDEQLEEKVSLLISASWGEQPLSDLADWVLEDGLMIRFQTQLHKVIWPNSFGPGV